MDTRYFEADDDSGKFGIARMTKTLIRYILKEVRQFLIKQNITRLSKFV